MVQPLRVPEVARLFAAGAEKGTGDVEKLLKDRHWRRWLWWGSAIQMVISPTELVI